MNPQTVIANNNPALSRPCSKVLIPNVGRVDLAQGHTSYFMDVMGQKSVNFVSVKDLRDLVVQGRARALRGRVGSEAQSLAFFQELEDISQGVIKTDNPSYEIFAGVWEQYCGSRLKGDDGVLSNYGKTVSRYIFVGKPSDSKNWRDAYTSYPLHGVPCDVCLFLTTLSKSKGSVNPFGKLDLKEIHDFFASKLVVKGPESNSASDHISPETTPDYNPTSPAIVVQDVPLAESLPFTVQASCSNQEEEHRLGKRRTKDSALPQQNSTKRKLTYPEVSVITAWQPSVCELGDLEW